MMPICSYLVIPERGAAAAVGERLKGLEGCDVARAENRDVLILVTDTPGLEEENELRLRVEDMDGIQALLLTFGEIDPETPLADPVAVGGRSGRTRRGLPVVGGGGGPSGASRGAPQPPSDTPGAGTAPSTRDDR